MKAINDGLTRSQRFYRKHKADLLKRNNVWRHANPDKVRQYRKDWYQRHKLTIRRRARLKSGCFNPPGDAFKIAICPICDREKRCVYDHCHSTGKHRGWLCTSCNLHLGWYERNSRKVSRYLNEHQGPTFKR